MKRISFLNSQEFLARYGAFSVQAKQEEFVKQWALTERMEGGGGCLCSPAFHVRLQSKPCYKRENAQALVARFG